ncbi:hypothetical protein [Peristeroidobacter agariperforans]|uniref:hypothetical protein n=1 Tax=Peristeroidobacter agariperforans TaxID=268404 RepID=UPI00101D7A16|nr:hypothetical protein [Peristeroidobacter agariperforans]
MERGVVVGGLMICGSFLLAAMLNRSAMEEVPVPVPPPAAAVQPLATPSATDCAEVSPRGDTSIPAVDVEPPAADLMVNGREACPR